MGKNKGNKGHAQPAQAPAAAPAAQAPAAPAATAPVGVLQVLKANAQFRGARAAWYAVLLAHNGQPVANWVQAVTASPPSVPKSGVVEKPQGWLGWFVRNGIAQVVPQGTPAPQAPPAP